MNFPEFCHCQIKYLDVSPVPSRPYRVETGNIYFLPLNKVYQVSVPTVHQRPTTYRPSSRPETRSSESTNRTSRNVRDEPQGVPFVQGAYLYGSLVRPSRT